jgi:hypothetical protein
MNFDNLNPRSYVFSYNINHYLSLTLLSSKKLNCYNFSILYPLNMGKLAKDAIMFRNVFSCNSNRSLHSTLFIGACVR